MPSMQFPDAGVELRIESAWDHGEYRYAQCRRVDLSGKDTRVLAAWVARNHQSPANVARLVQEFALAERLEGTWAATPRELLRERGRTVLVMDDAGGRPLRINADTPVKIGDFLHIAIEMVSALAGMHAAGLMHNDLTPAHILIDGQGVASLTGFGVATMLQAKSMANSPREEPVGTPAYMAPEQSGRINRLSDTRSDLYSLGIIFYEMLSGALPFRASDAREWIHSHLARRPVPLDERMPMLDRQLSRIVMKLLEKSADDRYQTAAGLQLDLRRCQDEWRASGAISSFGLGLDDISSALHVPAKLYGREGEVGRLDAAYRRVLTSGNVQVAVVSGAAGSGKTSLVLELLQSVAATDGTIVVVTPQGADKHIPYSALARAFGRAIVDRISKSSADLQQLRQRADAKLGDDAGHLADILPELQLILGPAKVYEKRASTERYLPAFLNLLAVFGTAGHPLVLFFDDLHGVDNATFGFILQLANTPKYRHVLLVLAYRDDASTLPAELAGCLRNLTQRVSRCISIELGSLELADVSALISETFRRTPADALPLARAVSESAGGNPFFILQLLSELVDEDAITFDPVQRRWSWDLTTIGSAGYRDCVIELVLKRFQRLPIRTRKALQYLACLGGSSPLSHLRAAWEPSSDVVAVLSLAVDNGLIARGMHGYRFRHDRIREAAYGQIPHDSQTELHLQIGRALLKALEPHDMDEDLYVVVEQLNRGADLIGGSDERVRLVELTLRAALRAKERCAFQVATEYLATALAMLGTCGTASGSALERSVTLHLAECEYLLGRLDPAERRMRGLASASTDGNESAAIAKLHVELLLSAQRREEAVSVGLQALCTAGVVWSSMPQDAEVKAEMESVYALLGDRPIHALADMPDMRSAAAISLMKMLFAFMPPTWCTNKNLRALVILRMVRTSLEHGNTDESCLAYSWLGMLLASTDAKMASRFGELAMELAARRQSDRIKAWVFQIVGGNLMQWSHPLRIARSTARVALEETVATGDLTYASYLHSNLITHALAIGDSIAPLQVRIESGGASTWGSRFEDVVGRIIPSRQLVRTLRGVTPVFGRFDDNQFDEGRYEEQLAAAKELPIGACFYWIRKLQARYLAGQYADAIFAAEQARTLLWTSPCYFEVAEFEFYAALSMAAACRVQSESQLTDALYDIGQHLRQLRSWAEDASSTFYCRAELVGAELARLEGRDSDAMRGYEAAINSARDNDFVHMQALASELAGDFYHAHGIESVGLNYLEQARTAYQNWGANAKVWQLDARYPDLHGTVTAQPEADRLGNSVQAVDAATVISVANTIAGEIRQDKVLHCLMMLALEHAGATRGVLVVAANDEVRVAATAHTEDSSIRVTVQDCVADASQLPLSLVHDVIESHEPLVIGNVDAPRRIVVDPYLSNARARSILCMPLLSRSELVGVLYLENELAPYVFVPARLEMLRVLVSQAAIALENSRLYNDARRKDESLHEARAELAHVSRVLTLNALTGSIAHEVSQPLASLSANAGAALRWLDRAEPNLKETKAALVEVVSETNRARSIINSMRALLKKTDHARDRVDIAGVVDETLSLISGELGKHRVDVARDIAPNLYIAGDKTQIQQVLLNLVVNGIEAMRDITDRARRIALLATRDDMAISIMVSDVGIGLPMHEPDQVFDTFYSTKPEGLGMGLSICRTIVQSHGGSLHASRNEPFGATFHLTLPAFLGDAA